MKNPKMFLVASVLWFVCSGIWIAALCVDAYYKVTPEGLMAMHVLCILTSLIAAIANLTRYRTAKKNDKKEQIV